MGYENATLTAQWSLNAHTLTYNGTEGLFGTEHSYTYDVVYGQKITVDENKFEADAYEFISWNTEPDGTGTTYVPNDVFSMPDEDIVLYAQWNKIGVETVYNGNGGETPEGEKEISKVFGLDEFIVISDNPFEYHGYEFLGWSTTPDGEVEYHPKDMYLGTTDITLYAVWLEIDTGDGVLTSSDSDSDPDSDKNSDGDNGSDSDKNTDSDKNSDSDTSSDSDGASDSDSDTDGNGTPLYGDVNCDGQVNMSDVVALQKIIAELTTHESYGEMSKTNSDCNHDGTINMLDVTQIQKYMAQLLPDLNPKN